MAWWSACAPVSATNSHAVNSDPENVLPCGNMQGPVSDACSCSGARLCNCCTSGAMSERLVTTGSAWGEKHAQAEAAMASW